MKIDRYYPKKVNSIPYHGYTNATTGLKSALEMLSEVNDGHIIMLSDGDTFK